MQFLLLFLFSQLPVFAREIICPSSVADPAVVVNDKKILVMGTGDTLQWNSLDALIQGQSPETKKLSLYQEVLVAGRITTVPLHPEELPWDLQIYRIGKNRYLYGGVMTPLAGETHARWPTDNISRRIKVAVYDPNYKGWVFRSSPLFGHASHHEWKGHSYGQQLVQKNGKLYLFHEEISSEGVTEIFVRELLTPFKAGRAKRIIGKKDLPEKLTKRIGGGFLLEGPRYQQIVSGDKKIHLLYFSTGDFPTNNYATRLAYSDTGILGPYKVLRENVTEVFAKKNSLYGVGRAFPFSHKNKNWIIFHGARKRPDTDHSLWPESLNQFNRCLFIAPVKYKYLRGNLNVKLDSDF